MQNDITRRGLLGGTLVAVGGLLVPRLARATPTPVFHPNPLTLFKEMHLLHHVPQITHELLPKPPARQFHLKHLGDLYGTTLYVRKGNTIPMLVVEPHHPLKLLAAAAMHHTYVGMGPEEEVIAALRKERDVHLVRFEHYIIGVDKEQDTFPALFRYTCPPLVRFRETLWVNDVQVTRPIGITQLDGYFVWNHRALACGIAYNPERRGDKCLNLMD